MEEDSEESIMEDREGFMEVYSGKNKNSKRKKPKDQGDSEDMMESMQDKTKRKTKDNQEIIREQTVKKC